MSILGKMSTTIRVAAMHPIKRMRRAAIAIVYGRRKARRTRAIMVAIVRGGRAARIGQWSAGYSPRDSFFSYRPEISLHPKMLCFSSSFARLPATASTEAPIFTRYLCSLQWWAATQRPWPLHGPADRRRARPPFTARLLVELDADVLDQLAVLFVVAANELRELRGRQDEGLEAARHVELLREIWARQDLLYFRAQRGHDRLRRARRGEQAEPDVDRISGIE